MQKSVIVHGPQGCGKTTHAEELRVFFKLDRIDDDPVEGQSFPQHGCLVLTNSPPGAEARAGFRVVSFENAMEQMHKAVQGTAIPKTPIENALAAKADDVNQPEHYRQGEVECIDAIRAALTPEEFRGYCKGNVLKYTWRERHKEQDKALAKARWYLNKLLGATP